MSKRRVKKTEDFSSTYVQNEIRQYIAAYKTTKRISIQLLASTLNTSLSQVEEELINLLDRGLIYGVLENGYFIRDLEAIGKCQLCDQMITRSSTGYQCKLCFRMICPVCAELAPTCPTHPRVQSKFIAIPLACPRCSMQIDHLGEVSKAFRCPSCKAVLKEQKLMGLPPSSKVHASQGRPRVQLPDSASERLPWGLQGGIRPSPVPQPRTERSIRGFVVSGGITTICFVVVSGYFVLYMGGLDVITFLRLVLPFSVMAFIIGVAIWDGITSRSSRSHSMDRNP